MRLFYFITYMFMVYITEPYIIYRLNTIILPVIIDDMVMIQELWASFFKRGREGVSWLLVLSKKQYVKKMISYDIDIA